ncbi:signal peptidase I [Nonomuraea sp. SMC257]|uniref:Signal peptidase I n=1 Tax=Nonomuraea montanisoli TaxID=2741721 RepID=A0A7Y6I2Z7_9ACTN|nr:signal peptidase I [Nonomuraea montanisoli]NUW30599.1 signal peptidase I [Nonomuraea montanisoli]
MNLISGGLLAGVAVAVVGVLLARRRYVVVTVDGVSMAPTLNDGDRILVRRRRLEQVSRGDVVVLEPTPDPTGRILPGPPGPDGRRWNIKRAVALPGDPVPPDVPVEGDVERVPAGALVVFGDNERSFDSRQRGFFHADRLLGVALRRLGGSSL